MKISAYSHFKVRRYHDHRIFPGRVHMPEKIVFVLKHVPLPYQCSEMIQNINTFAGYLKNEHVKGKQKFSQGYLYTVPYIHGR